MEIKSLIESMIQEKLNEQNINDMKVSAEMKSLLQMKNITSAFGRSGAEASLKDDKQALAKEINKVINQLKRKEDGKSSKYEKMLPDLVKKYEEVMAKRKELTGSSFPYQDPSSFKDGRKLDEIKDDYTISHKTFSSAVQHAMEVVEKRGYEVDEDEWDRKVALGPRKPSKGKTNSYTISLLKNGKETPRKLQMQVYYDEGRFELNMYIS